MLLIINNALLNVIKNWESEIYRRKRLQHAHNVASADRRQLLSYIQCISCIHSHKCANPSCCILVLLYFKLRATHNMADSRLVHYWYPGVSSAWNKSSKSTTPHPQLSTYPNALRSVYFLPISTPISRVHLYSKFITILVISWLVVLDVTHYMVGS